MKIVRVESVEWFLEATANYRAAEPVRTNILGSVATSVLARARHYDAYWWWLVYSADDDVVGAAFRTAPFGLQLAPMPLEAAAPLAAAVAREDDAFPWFGGDADVASQFLLAYERTGSPDQGGGSCPGSPACSTSSATWRYRPSTASIASQPSRTSTWSLAGFASSKTSSETSRTRRPIEIAKC